MPPAKRPQQKERRGARSAPAKPAAPRETPAAKPAALRENRDGGRRLPDVERDDKGVDSGLAQPTESRGVRSASTRGKYVYCVIQATESLKFGAIGLGAEPAEVHTVHHKDIAAVVSDTPIEVPDATRENVLAHERVNENVMRSHTVIPMSFGTVFKTPNDIVELLRGAYDAFHDVLGKMQDKLEFGLKLLWDRDVAIREVEKEDEEVRRLKSEISSQKGSTYFARMQYGRLLESALSARSERYANEILAQLRDVSVASRTNKPIGDKMIMNAAFLVSRDQESAFDARVKELGARYDRLTFRYTGPWPPYNFVNIRLKLERARESE
jgi:hypothetical protein